MNVILNNNSIFLKSFWINIKNIYSSLLKVSIIFLSPIFLVFCLSVTLPYQLMCTLGQIFVVPLSAGVVFGTLFFSINNSIFLQKANFSKLNIFKVYISIFCTMIFVTFISEFLYWLSLFIFYNIGILNATTNYPNLSGWKNFKIYLDQVEWVIIFYYFFMSNLFVFLTSLSVAPYIKTIKNYYFLLFTYIVFLLPYGGTYQGLNIVNKNNYIYMNNKFSFNQFLSYINPQFHLNNFVTKASISGVFNSETNLSFNNLNVLNSFSISKDWKWNLTIFYPIFANLGLMFSQLLLFNKKY